MKLDDQMVAQGQSLFRWRSYFPFLFVALGIGGLLRFHFIFNSHLADEIWDAACLLVGFGGLAIRILTVGFVPHGTSGRNTRALRAPTLNTTGMYSLLRHPLYLGNFFIFMSFVLFIHEPLLIVLAVLAYWMYYERIMLAEEAFLRGEFGAAYDDWAERTPAIWPRFNDWQSPSMPFCWRTVLKREYTTLGLLVSVLFLMEVTAHAVVEHRVHIDLWWLIIGAFGGATYLGIWAIKHWTRWLHVTGR